jgi:hypothetical protein
MALMLSAPPQQRLSGPHIGGNPVEWLPPDMRGVQMNCPACKARWTLGLRYLDLNQGSERKVFVA